MAWSARAGLIPPSSHGFKNIPYFVRDCNQGYLYYPAAGENIPLILVE